MPFCYLSAQTLIMRIISDASGWHWLLFFFYPRVRASLHRAYIPPHHHHHLPPSHSHLHRAAVHANTGTKTAISPLLLRTWSAWELVPLCQAHVHALTAPLTSDSDPASQSGAEEARREQRDKSGIIVSYLVRRLQRETAIPSAGGRRTPIHSRNPVCGPCRVLLPPPSSSLSLVEREAAFRASPAFILPCQRTPAFMPWMMEIKKKKKEGDIKQREDASSRDLFSSSPPAPLFLRSHTLKQAHEGETSESPRQRCMCFRSAAPHLFFPPLFSTSLCVTPLPSLSVSPPVRGALVHTQTEAALPWRVRQLYACKDICECAYVWGGGGGGGGDTKVAS